MPLLGLDWGGLSREFFELLCAQLFDVSDGLFMRFDRDNHQALVSTLESLAYLRLKGQAGLGLTEPA